MVLAKFVASKGKAICPKCGGDTEIDLTERDPNGWPVGPFKRMTCDHCEGEGEVTPVQHYVEGQRVEVEAVAIIAYEPPNPGWPGQATQPTPPPSTGSAAGWPMFHTKEPGK